MALDGTKVNANVAPNRHYDGHDVLVSECSAEKQLPSKRINAIECARPRSLMPAQLKNQRHGKGKRAVSSPDELRQQARAASKNPSGPKKISVKWAGRQRKSNRSAQLHGRKPRPKPLALRKRNAARSRPS